MKVTDKITELKNIRGQITDLGHDYLQTIVPLPLEKVLEAIEPFSDAEKAIDNIIKELEK